jgi:hypothetical protein
MQVMSPEWLLEVARGNVKGAKIIHKFGANRSVGTTWATVCTSGTYQVPTTPQTLEIVSDSADDSVSGIGARSVEVYGIDANWDEIEEVVEMNGTTPVTLANQFRRVYRMHVYESGSYSNLFSGSHVGNITVQGVGGGSLYADIVVENGFPLGASEIGCFTIPRGYTGFIIGSRVVMEATKICDVGVFIRQHADILTPPYSPLFIIDIIHDVSNLQVNKDYRGFSRPLVGPCDTGFLANTVSGTAKLSVQYDILILDNNTRDKIGS